MRKLSVLLALLALMFCDLALAAGAVATAVTGTVQAQTGPAAPRALKQGDPVAQGDTVITGANSTVVLRFDDGQVTALTPNSRLQVTTYDYNPATQSGNSLLSLVTGGMRAITGLIGARTPDRVAYRAATATIGIRGTDIQVTVIGDSVVVTVFSGNAIYQVSGQLPRTVTPGQTLAQTQAGIIQGLSAQVIQQLAPQLQNAVQVNSAAITSISNAINAAVQQAAASPVLIGTSSVNVTVVTAGGTPASCAGNTCTCPSSAPVRIGNTCCPTGSTAVNAQGQCTQ